MAWRGAFQAAACAASAPLLGCCGGALCDSLERKVGEFSAGSGMIFKDTVEVTSMTDPKVDGVVVHVSSMKRPITDRIRRDFFTDPSQTSLTATRMGPVTIKEPIALGPSGEAVFTSRKNLFFKTSNVRRIYDEESHCLVYVSYTTRLTTDMEEANSRFRTSISAVPLDGAISKQAVLSREAPK